MSNALKALMRGSAADKLYSDDVYATWLRSGTGASATITTGFQPDLVITKARSATTGWRWTDSARGVGTSLDSSTTAGNASESQGLTAFGATGYTIGTDTDYNNSTGPVTYVDFALKKAPKFLDVVTYTGDGGNNRAISHSLGGEPGMIVVKRLTNFNAGTANWAVYHRSLSPYTTGQGLLLNTTNAFQNMDGGYRAWGTSPSFTSTSFTVGTDSTQTSLTNASGDFYVAYLFAHDTGTDGIIQCGSYVGSSGTNFISLGWEPQFVLQKASSASATDWHIQDNMRGMPVSGTGKALRPNSSIAEYDGSNAYPAATGFFATGDDNNSGTTYIYLAIRRPNKPPTSGTGVYNSVTHSGTSAQKDISVGFAADCVVNKIRNTVLAEGHLWADRLRGFSATATAELESANTDAEVSRSQAILSMGNTAVTYGTSGTWNFSTATYIAHFLRRAPGFFDVVCYTGTGSATTVAHNLGAVPELMIVKGRNVSQGWVTYSAATGSTAYLLLQQTAASSTSLNMWNNTTPTISEFSVTSQSAVNQSSATYVAYLFASLPGISKVFSYTGNGGSADSAGTSQTINCGFSAGARFVMLKCTSHTSDWAVIDTARGLVAGNDPTLSLNTTAAEVTGQDLLDPDNSGFIVNQLGSAAGTSANFNVTGRTYIGIAIS